MIFEIVKFGKFLEFSQLRILGIPEIGNFWNLLNCKFLKFCKLEILGIFKINNSWNFTHWKFLKFVKLPKLENYQIFRIFSIWKPKFGFKNCQFWNCWSIRFSAPLAISPILIFALWYKLILSILLPHWGSYVFAEIFFFEILVSEYSE